MKDSIFVPFDKLPEAKNWQMGSNYRTRFLLKQTGLSEQGATFDVVDASSLELRDKANEAFMSEGGSYVGR